MTIRSTERKSMLDALPYRTERLILRRLRVADLDAFHAYRRSEDVARFQGWSPMTRNEALEFLRNEDSDKPLEPGAWRQIGIADESSDRLIGDIGINLSSDQRSAEFGLSIHPELQGRGLGAEAVNALFELLFLHTPIITIVAAADVRNTPCIRMLEKAGMYPTGERAADYKGEPCTERLFAKHREAN